MAKISNATPPAGVLLESSVLTGTCVDNWSGNPEANSTLHYIHHEMGFRDDLVAGV
jgi:hypothetical protein